MEIILLLLEQLNLVIKEKNKFFVEHYFYVLVVKRTVRPRNNI